MSSFADETAQLAVHLVAVEKWLADWRIKVNELKCKHVTFTLNRRDCPPLTKYCSTTQSKNQSGHMERAQLKIIRTITGAQWYFRNDYVQKDLNIIPVRDVTAKTTERYYNKPSTLPNHLAEL